MPELLDLVEDWQYNPPLVSLVEALVYGLSRTKKPKRPAKSEGLGFDEFLTKTGGKVSNSDGTVAVFDLDEMRRRNEAVRERRNARRLASAKAQPSNVRDSA